MAPVGTSKRGQATQKGPAAKRARRPPKKKAVVESSDADSDADPDAGGDSDDAAAAGGGGELANLHAALNAPLRVQQLERENEELRLQVADLQSQLDALVAPATKLTYTVTDHKKFLEELSQPTAINLLDLSQLVRATNSYTGNWYKTWKPDKKLDTVTIALLTATSNVKGLDLGDAPWASEDKYVKELRALLVKYKKSLTYLRVTMRALVDRYIVQKTGKAKYRQPETYVNVDIMTTVASCPKLERLAIVFDHSADHPVYGGEFNSNIQKKSHFPKLKQIEVTLTKRWGTEHLGEADKSCESDAEGDASADTVPYWQRAHPREADDIYLKELLTYQAPIITLLDMREVSKPKVGSPSATTFPALLSKLTALRSIVLRAEWLPVTEKMKQLESLDVVVSGRLSGATIEALVALVAASGPLQRLKRLHVCSEGFKVKEKHSALLRAFAEHCSRLEVVCIKGCGWKEDDLTVLLERGAHLRELRLNECVAVEEQHLPLILSLRSLAILRLPCRLRGKPLADDILDRSERNGLDLQFQQ